MNELKRLNEMKRELQAEFRKTKSENLGIVIDALLEVIRKIEKGVKKCTD